MKVLITGCAGYIGSVLTQHFLELKYDVVGIDNFSYNNQFSIQGLLRYNNFELLPASVFGDDVHKLYTKADVIIPLAALVGAPICDKSPGYAYSVNYHAIKTMLAVLSKNQKVIFPNTNSGYGTKGEALCTEDSPLEPISVYGRSKCEAEKVILDRKNSVSFRLATVCGPSPRMRFDLMVNDFCAKVWHEQKFTMYEPDYKRNFVHINDVVRAFDWALWENLEGVYNLGHPEGNMTKLELVKLIIKEYNKPALYTIGEGKDVDQRNYVVSNDKILSTGFKFGSPIEKAIRQVGEVCKLYHIAEISIMGNIS